MKNMLKRVNSGYDYRFNVKNRSNNIDIFLFSAYFSAMMNLYTYRYIQLLSQLILIIYIWFVRTKGRYKIKDFRIAKKYFYWYGLFTCWAWVSLIWTEQISSDMIRILITMLRIAVISTSIIYYLTKTGNFEIVFKGLIYGGITFVFITIAINPISSWMKRSFISLDSGFVRTGIAEICLLYIFFLQFSKYIFPHKIFSDRQRHIYLLLFIFLMILTGARKQILQLLLWGAIITVLKSFKVKRKYLVLLVLACFLFFPVVFNRIFYEHVIVELVMLFKGFNSLDPSTIARLTYIKTGLNIAKDNLFLGQGVDAFRNYLMQNRVNTKFGPLDPTYSHCNYIEILDSFGLIGLMLFYRWHLNILIANWKYRKINTKSLFLLSILFILLIGDMGTINYFVHIYMYFYAILFYLNEI